MKRDYKTCQGLDLTRPGDPARGFGLSSEGFKWWTDMHFYKPKSELGEGSIKRGLESSVWGRQIRLLK